MFLKLESLWLTFPGSMAVFGDSAMAGLPVSAIPLPSGDIKSWGGVRDQITNTFLLEGSGRSTLYFEHLTKVPPKLEEQQKAQAAFKRHLDEKRAAKEILTRLQEMPAHRQNDLQIAGNERTYRRPRRVARA